MSTLSFTCKTTETMPQIPIQWVHLVPGVQIVANEVTVPDQIQCLLLFQVCLEARVQNP
jgi:hypothetical protein